MKRKPPNCPEHSGEPIDWHNDEAELTNEQVERLTGRSVTEIDQLAKQRERVAAAEKRDNEAFEAHRAHPSSEPLFKAWLVANERFLNELTALRAREGKTK